MSVVSAVKGNELARKRYKVAAGRKTALTIKLSSKSRATLRTAATRKLRIDVVQGGVRTVLGVVRAR